MLPDANILLQPLALLLLGLLISAPTIGIFTIALSSGEDILLGLQTDLAVSQL